MQLGAYWAGLAIENSMLGATHACANPLTAHYDTEHGIAIGLMLPHVVRWNGQVVSDRYHQLVKTSSMTSQTALRSGPESAAESLASRLEELLLLGGLKRGLKAAGVPVDDLPLLAEEAGRQWTGQFNPRSFGAKEALELYHQAY
jgi:alcohol dehydrogenase